MTRLGIGVRVSHSDYGDGTVIQILGSLVRVDFFGVPLDVDEQELELVVDTGADVDEALGENGVLAVPLSRQKYFTSIEAINLGVVPPDSEQLLHFTMNGAALTKEIKHALENARTKGLSKVVIGHYGTGKTHYLQLVRSVALMSGWVVAFVEFDPKAADPAKPQLVYRHILSSLEFPARQDGGVVRGFVGLVKEVRAHWQRADIKRLPFFRLNPWFRDGLMTLLAHNHDEEDETYLAGCAWLAGDKQLASIRSLAKEARLSTRVPAMPTTKETAEIYAFHLVVVNEIVRQLGYKGLLLILDEAEHVRGYSMRRKERANNFFDYLARCAHSPMDIGDLPAPNDHGYELPKFWGKGPHFGLYVGLTPSFGIPQTREDCVFIRSSDDVLVNRSPSSKDYKNWLENLLEMFHKYCPEDSELFSDKINRQQIADALGEMYVKQLGSSTPLRNWIKLGGLACSVPLVDRMCSVDTLIDHLTDCGEQITSL